MAETTLYLSNSLKISTESIEDDILLKVNDSLFDFDPVKTWTTDTKKEYIDNFKRESYKKFLSSHFENLVILSGAGTSVECGGPTMADLWNHVVAEYGDALFLSFCKKIKYCSDTDTLPTLKKNLEALLSKANLAKHFIDKKAEIEEVITKFEKIIHSKISLSLPDNSPHELFLNKITNRKLKDPRAKIFTLNYDTLFEQAAIKGNFTIIDGFSFSNPRTLNGRNFDYDIVYRENSRIKEEESFAPKVFHLYKPHGSIDWEFNEVTGKIQINDKTTKSVMVYPKDSKYENSYDQPFFEMMSRFQQNMRKDNVLLITIGFSFGDKHFVTAIKEAVSQNPSFRLLIIVRTIREDSDLKWFLDWSSKNNNVIIVSELFKEFSENYPYSTIYSGINDNQNYNV